MILVAVDNPRRQEPSRDGVETAAAADDRTGAPDGGLPTAVAVFRTEPESTSACVAV